MKRLFIAASLFTCLLSATAQTSVEEIQAEIAELKRRIQELEAYKARLEALEAQLQQAKQTPTASPMARLSGFVQFRYVHDTSLPQNANNLQQGSARDSLILRTARLDAIARPRPDTLYRVNLNANERQVSVSDAFIELRRPEGRYQIGLFRVPLLYETLESNADRLTPDASEMVNTLFPTERDVGIAFTRPLNEKTELTVGVFTGDRGSVSQRSLTSRKSLLTRFRFQPSKGFEGWLGAIVGEGRRTYPPDNTPANYSRERYGGGFLWQTNNWFARGEVLWGRDGSNSLVEPTANVQGGYLLVGYRVPDSPWLLFGKYDTYDPNTKVSGDVFTRYAIGAQYGLNASTRLNFTYETPISPTRSEQWTLQFQVRY